MTGVFRIATGLLLLHALDDAFFHRGPGLGVDQHVLAAAISLAAGIAAIVAFPRLRAGLRAAVAFALGGLGIVNGALHLIHVTEHGASGSDITGVVAVAAGAVLVGLAAVIPIRHRGEGSAVSRLVAVPVAVVALFFVLVPVGMGIVASHKWREPVGEPPGPAYAEVGFRASDGLRLAGWYRPSRNGAAVLVVHGGSSDRKGSVAHARMLAAHGYGVLLYDARGRGESDGTENNYGWDWPKDIAGALAFLREREDVDPERIAALGLSTGADALLEVAGTGDGLAALVSDGAAAASFADGQNLNGTGIHSVPSWLMFSTIRVLSGDPPGPPLADLVPRIDEPTLLISAGTDIERDFNVLYDRVARGPVEHWNLPRAHHTDAIYEQRDAYERRVVAFLDRELR
jgi:esterase/lipase